MINSIRLFLLGAILSSNAALAQTEILSISSSSDCGDLDTEVVRGSRDRNEFSESLRIFFNNFGIQQSKRGFTSKNCQIVSTLNIPAGQQFRAKAAVMAGVYSTGSAATGGVKLGYELDATNGKAFWRFDFAANDDDDFTATVEVEKDDFTVCSNRDQKVVLTSDIELFLNHGNSSSFSFIEVDEGSKKHDLSWNWQLRKCPSSGNFFSKTFDTFFKVDGGRNVRAEMRFNGSTGYYESSDVVGEFYNVTYENEGKVAKGKWRTNSTTGTFRFTILDINSGRFKGEWTDETGTTGTWRGSYR